MHQQTRRAKKEDLSTVVDQDQRYFLNPESVSRHLFCSICQEVFAEPQRAPCGHSFCKQCILQWLKKASTCPDDRRPLKKSDLHHDFILENIIGDQIVACPFRKLGCQYVGQLQTSASHKKECLFNPSNMPEFLKEEALKNSFEDPNESRDCDPEDSVLPEPPKPSLKMRLFAAGGKQRELLCAMFEDKSRMDHTDGQSKNEKENNSKKRKIIV